MGARRCALQAPAARRRLSARPSWGSLRYVRRRAPPVAVRGNASGGGGDGGAKEEDREDKEAVASAGLGSPEVSKQRTAHAAAPEMDTAARGALAQRMQLLATAARTLLPKRLVRLAFFARVARVRALRQAANAAPEDAKAQVAYLRVLAKGGKAAAVVKRFESTPGAAMNAAAVALYLRALVATGKLRDFELASRKLEKAAAEDAIATKTAAGAEGKTVRADAAAAALAAGNERTLAQLLEELGARAAGGGGALEPGTSPARPLHVVMGGAGALGMARARRGPLGFLRELASSLLFMVALVVAWLFGMGALKRYVAGSPNVQGAVGASAGAGQPSSYAPKEFNKEAVPEKSLKTFDDVLGCDEAKEELQEIVQFLKHPERFSRLGGELPKGVLLAGPPGTGKTLLAKAVAGEAGVPFFYRAGSEFEEMFVGVGSRRVRQLFAAAKKKAPCIVFIDEIDAVGGNRKAFESHTRKTLNQLLTEMDGFEHSEGVVVLASTNIPESLDPALTRPGRFDRHVVVPLPDLKGRRLILEHYLAKKPVSEEVRAKVGQLARGTPGLSGADLNNLVNTAAIKAAVEDAKEVTLGMLEFAKDKILMGAERKSMSLTEEGRRLTAFHEAGHALVALRTKGAMPIHKATIMPRGSSLGMTMQLPEHKDETSQSKEQMFAELDICMGGRIAEELVFGADKVTTGASGDLEQATRIANLMVTRYGFSEKAGLASHDRNSLSGEMKRVVDEEVKRMLNEAYERATAVLKAYEKDLHNLAEELLDKETMDAAQIRKAVGLPVPEEGGGASAAKQTAGAATAGDVAEGEAGQPAPAAV